MGESIFEMIFLLDLFREDRDQIAEWRVADKKVLKQSFPPIAVRKPLDTRDGFTTQKREATCKLFSELAAHPTIKSAQMLRPKRDGDAVLGPFIEKTSLDAVLSKVGRLASQAGLILIAFIPLDWPKATESINAFLEMNQRWLADFYPDAGSIIS